MKPVKSHDLRQALIDALAGQKSAEPSSLTANAPDGSPAMVRPLRILLAEDNRINQMVGLRILQHLGYQADLAASGKEVLELLRRQPYDVVLMDVYMPGMDGLEATRVICAEWPEQDRPRIIAMTANAMDKDKEKCLAAGMDAFLSKPIRIDELRSTLEGLELPSRERRNPDTAALKTIDTSILDDLAKLYGDDDDDPVAQLIKIYLEDTPPRLNAMRQAVKTSDEGELKFVAHAIKGTSASIGAQRIAALCDELEENGLDSRPERIEELVTEVEAEFSRVRGSLELLADSFANALLEKRLIS
ncbi:MAG: response regulator [Acidobacteriota bacterium]